MDIVAANGDGTGGRELFGVPREVSYFNTAGIAPTLTASLEAGRAALAWRARPWEIRTDDWFDGAERRRTLFASLVGATAADIALIPATSYGCATAAANVAVGPGRQVVVLDGESAGAVPLDVREVRPDFLFAVGYKWLLGPFGLGCLYVDPAHHGGRPLEENWIVRRDARDFSRLVDYRDAYQDGARRFDVGQRTEFELTPMAVAALEQMNAWTPSGVARALARHTARIGAAAQAAGWTVPEPRGPHMLGVHLPAGVRPRLLEYLEARGIHTAARGDALRISPHMHTTDEDVDRLTAAFRRHH
ncbi:hypothetical protein [Streptomyces lavendulae]|uniref:hypothetical protein n=1 Tax=Streptomyces lavendulae TaxID=1914 RepID=UPI00340BDC93